MSTIKIYHNPDCGTLRNTLGLMVRQALREKGTPFMELGLDNTALTDAQLLDAVQEHPILMNRPFVVTPLGVRLRRPAYRDERFAAHGAFTSGAYCRESVGFVWRNTGNPCFALVLCYVGVCWRRSGVCGVERLLRYGPFVDEGTMEPANGSFVIWRKACH